MADPDPAGPAVGDALIELARTARMPGAASLASGRLSAAGAAWMNDATRARLAIKVAEANRLSGMTRG